MITGDNVKHTIEVDKHIVCVCMYVCYLLPYSPISYLNTKTLPNMLRSRYECYLLLKSYDKSVKANKGQNDI